MHHFWKSLNIIQECFSVNTLKYVYFSLLWMKGKSNVFSSYFVIPRKMNLKNASRREKNWIWPFFSYLMGVWFSEFSESEKN